jgi:hypothetical protein
MKYNIKAKEKGIDATVMEVPDYVGTARERLPSRSGAIANMVSDIGKDNLTVRGITSTQDDSTFNPDGIMQSGLYDEPLTMDPSEMETWARGQVPVEDDPSCLDWMVPATAANTLLTARKNEYARAGSRMKVASGDPFTPGVTNGQMAFASEPASVIQDRGSAKLSLNASVTEEIPVPGNDTIVKPDFLGWASATDIQEKQWIGSMMSIEQLTSNPSSPIGFPNVAGETGPLFLGHSASRPAIINRVSMGIQSNKSQTLGIKLRDNSDYTRVLNSFNIDVPKGRSTVNFRTLSLNFSPMAAEIMPENGTQTVLTDYSVAP